MDSARYSKAPAAASETAHASDADSLAAFAGPGGISTRPGAGLAVGGRHDPGVHPFETVEWGLRDARIGHGGNVAFEQLGVEFPRSWSQNATNIVAQKYFRGQLGSAERSTRWGR